MNLKSSLTFRKYTQPISERMTSGLISSIVLSNNGILMSSLSSTFPWISATLYIGSHLDPLTSKPRHIFRKST